MNKDPQLRARRPSKKTLVNCAAAALLLAGCDSGGEGNPNPDASSTVPSSSPTVAGPTLPSSSSSSAQAAPAPKCKFPEMGSSGIDTWGTPPTVLDEELLAAHMGVSVEAVKNGMAGVVTCDPGVPVEILGTPADLLTIEGLPQEWDITSPCVPISLDVAAPTAGNVAMNPTVVCPAVDQST